MLWTTGDFTEKILKAYNNTFYDFSGGGGTHGLDHAWGIEYHNRVTMGPNQFLTAGNKYINVDRVVQLAVMEDAPGDSRLIKLVYGHTYGTGENAFEQ